MIRLVCTDRLKRIDVLGDGRDPDRVCVRAKKRRLRDEKKRARQSSPLRSVRSRRLTEAHPLDVVEMIDDPKPRAVAVVLDPAGATGRRAVGRREAVGDDLSRRRRRTFRRNKHRGSRSQHSALSLLSGAREERWSSPGIRSSLSTRPRSMLRPARLRPKTRERGIGVRETQVQLLLVRMKTPC